MKNQESPDTQTSKHRKVSLDPSVEIVEIDFSTSRTIRILPVNSKGPIQEYFLKITPKRRLTLI